MPIMRRGGVELKVGRLLDFVKSCMGKRVDGRIYIFL